MSRGSATDPDAGQEGDPDGSADPRPEDPSADEAPDIDEGRYLYCVVRVDDGDGRSADDPNGNAPDADDPGDDAPEFDATGVDGEPVSLVTVDGIAAVVHACDGLYDSSDLAQVRRWLVRHQSVVDEAGQAFGTPLPFQFDTIVRGDDEAVRDWLRRERETVAGALDSLAGHWEYRIEVVETDPTPAETLAAEDEQLAEMRERIDEADEGEAFLLEKRYEKRLADLREHRRSALTDDLRRRIAEHAREVHELERSPSATLEGAEDASDDGETVGRLTLLADENEEEAIGAILDDVAAEPGLEVRFTGPWPPYTFAPDLGGAADDESPDDRSPDGERPGRDSRDGGV